jgi:hypothetical protein
MKSSDIKAVARTAAAPSEPLTAGCAESVEKGSSMVVRSIACRHNTVEQAMRQLQQSSLQARAECEGSIHCVGWLCLQVCIPLPDPLPGCCKPPCLQPMPPAAVEKAQWGCCLVLGVGGYPAACRIALQDIALSLDQHLCDV